MTSLKGRMIESLNSSTYEHIILKPLYTRQDEQPVPDYSGGSDFRRGIYSLGYITNEWKIAQRLNNQTVGELKEKLSDALEKGQTAISFEMSQDLFETNENLSTLLTGLFNQFHFAINAKEWHGAFLDVMAKLADRDKAGDKINGYLGSDPLSLFAVEGYVSEESISAWVKNIEQANKRFPNLRTIQVDTVPYHNGGANAVQELAIAIAEGVYYLERLQEDEMDLDQILTKIVFQFSIGSNFFMEIGKLRAARVLWNRITELYGAKEDARGMVIAAETSSFTKTVQDSHVNLLRAGNEAFAAVIGGVQYLHVAPFDNLTGSTPFSERIARNIQLLLKEEAQLKKVIDPAGGSWYVEDLTNQLAEKAWEYFQQIEARGGIVKVLETNWLQQEINAIYEKRNFDIQTRKQTMIGTNAYAALAENVTYRSVMDKKTSLVDDEKLVTKIEAIPARRLAEPFEELRRKAKYLEAQTGSIPAVGIICLGQLKQYKARLDFMKGFLAAGGLKAIESKSIVSIENAKQFILEQPTRYFCFCGSNDHYDVIGHDILTAISAEFPDRIFYLAGLPDKEHHALWQKEGIEQFIHVETNCYETLTAILNDLEVSTVEETKA